MTRLMGKRAQEHSAARMGIAGIWLAVLAGACSAAAGAAVEPVVRSGAAAVEFPIIDSAWVDSAEQRRLGNRVAASAAEYLRARQDASTGLWSAARNGAELPAVTALAVEGLLLDPRTDLTDPAVERGVTAILGYTTPEGGIHDGVLPAYNTAICVSALSRAGDARSAAAVERGVAFLRTLQFGGEQHALASGGQSMEPVSESHPFYGGVGYGTHGRPDLSNTSIFLDALRAAGVSANDPAYQRALIFLRRVQMHGSINEMGYASDSAQGGFIYATVPDAESVDSIPGQSQAGEITETLPDGRAVVRLRAYGSMTYAGFKSLLYADLDRDDPRVVLALGWIGEHYTVEENPGIGLQGYYYYLATMARALDAAGIDMLTDADGQERDWRAELIERLAELQDEDGSFRPQHPRWMEDNRTLITAYGLIALRHALR